MQLICYNWLAQKIKYYLYHAYQVEKKKFKSLLLFSTMLETAVVLHTPDSRIPQGVKR